MPDDPLQQQTRTDERTRRKHPFRRVAVETYQRGSQVDTPELTLRWWVLLPFVGGGTILMAVLIW
jgi:hypothetical protein